MTTLSRAAAASFAAVSLGTTMVAALWLDTFAAGRAPWLVAALAAVLLALPWSLPVPWRPRWLRSASMAAAVGVVAVVVLPWHPRKAFVRALFAIPIGADVDTVARTMRPYQLGPGRKWGGDGGAEAWILRGEAPADGPLTFRWNDADPRYDSDWGLVEFAGGRVVRVEFLPD